MQLNHWIDLWKISTLPYLWILRYYSQNDSLRAWFYIATHGTYGVLWCLKEYIAPDRRFHTPLTLRMGILSSIYLAQYLIAPTVLMISGGSNPTIGGNEFLLWFMMYMLGIFLHFGADIQKYHVLRWRRRLIMDGFFSYMKHPNYFGEALIYLSFCGISGIAWSYPILCFQIGVGWMPAIRAKEYSLSRYPEWEEYSSRCWF